MIVPHRYAHEKFMAAVETLAVSTAPLQERLLNAYLSSLIHLTEDDVAPLGEELSGRASELLNELGDLNENGLLTVDGADAERLSDEIVQLNQEVTRKFYADDLGVLDD